MARGEKRRLNENDIEGFFHAASRRPRYMSKEDIILQLKKDNWFRWWRLNNDFKWLKRRLKKMGTDPEQARELLP